MIPAMSVTAVIITKNEERQIRRCLDSLRPWVSEIIIIDDESRDQTVAIARDEYQAEIILSVSRGNFDKQRNLGIARASNPWILQMDADEAIPCVTVEKIQEVLKKQERCSAYTLKRRDYVFGVPLQHAYNAPGIKLFRKDKGRYVSNKIHETLEIDGPVGQIDVFVDHYNIVTISETLNKYNFYTDIESKIEMSSQECLDIKTLKKNLLNRTVKIFYKIYIKQRAYRDGIYGLIWAVLHVLYPLIHWLKVGEIAIKEKRLK